MVLDVLSVDVVVVARAADVVELSFLDKAAAAFDLAMPSEATVASHKLSAILNGQTSTTAETLRHMLASINADLSVRIICLLGRQLLTTSTAARQKH